MWRSDARGPGLDLDAFCHVEHARLVRLLSLHCGDPDLARDLAQETLVRVCVHWRKVRRLDVPEAWVTRVALNLSISSHRRAKVARRNLQELGARSVAVAEDPSDAAGVRAVLASLPERQRAALILRYYLDYSVEQTADAMSVSPSAVKKLASRGLAGMRLKLDVDVEVTDR